jgi:hypothetical protein
MPEAFGLALAGLAPLRYLTFLGLELNSPADVARFQLTGLTQVRAWGVGPAALAECASPSTSGTVVATPV